MVCLRSFEGVMGIIIGAAFLSAILAIAMSAQSASLYMPMVDSGGDSFETAKRINDLDTTCEFFGEIQAMTPGNPSGARYYSFYGEDGMEFCFHVDIPRGQLARPFVLLAGPGIAETDEAAENIIDSANITIPEGYGALGWAFVMDPLADYYITSNFDPITQTTSSFAYYGELMLPSDGTYYIIFTSVIYNEHLDQYSVIPSKYVLSTNYGEAFGISDYALLPLNWIKVRESWSNDSPNYLFILPITTAAMLFAADAWRKMHDHEFRMIIKSDKLIYFSGIAGTYLMMGFAAYQLSFIAFYQSHHHFEGTALLITAIQISGAILGIGAYMFMRTMFFRLKSYTLVAAALIAIFALLLGAGLIMGPILFIASLFTVAAHRQCTHESGS